MKKVLLLSVVILTALLGSVSLSSCGDDNGDDVETSDFGFSKSSYTALAGSVGQLDFKGNPTSWSSSNDFIASVSKDGTISANHVGKCEITMYEGLRGARCTFEVMPVYTTYTDPYIKWGAKKDAVKAYEKRNLLKEESKSLYYEEKGSVRGLGYVFDNTGLSGVMVVIEHRFNTDIARELAEFLKERYRVISVSATESYFSDGSNAENSKTLITVDINPKDYPGYLIVYYTPYPKSK